MRALVTGSAGLVGSSCVGLLCSRGWEVVGVDNDMRARFFGPDGSTARSAARLLAENPARYRHVPLDVRDREGVRVLLRRERPSFIVHAAAQPSHDLAAQIPYDDFDVNAVGTLNLLQAAREYCAGSPFVFVSTNKVYGVHPNGLALRENCTRFDFVDRPEGIDESMSIDDSLHSLFGASKVAADVLAQEYGKYFDMPVGVFRGGCLTGPRHAGVPQHGFLSYAARCAATGAPYVVHGYGGKQVRDQLHADDLAALFLEFYERPHAGAVYNVGGGRANSISILELADALSARGFPLRIARFEDEARRGDHVCYYTDMAKARAHFPQWSVRRPLARIIDEVLEAEVLR